MKNMDKGLTVTKCLLINWRKIPQMPQNLSAQIVCPSPKDWEFDEKRLHWVFIVRAPPYYCSHVFISTIFFSFVFTDDDLEPLTMG